MSDLVWDNRARKGHDYGVDHAKLYITPLEGENFDGDTAMTFEPGSVKFDPELLYRHFLDDRFTIIEPQDLDVDEFVIWKKGLKAFAVGMDMEMPPWGLPVESTPIYDTLLSERGGRK